MAAEILFAVCEPAKKLQKDCSAQPGRTQRPKHNILFNRTKQSFNLYLIGLAKRALNVSKIKAKAVDRA
jgi:hypothetical protein